MRRKIYYDLESGRWFRSQKPEYRPTLRTPEARRKDIVERYRLRRHGMDESWVVLGREISDWRLVSPEEQRRAAVEQRRLETAKWYGVPVSFVWSPDELKKWRAERAAAKPIDNFLTDLSSVRAELKACLQTVARRLPLVGSRVS